ncbi:MAG: apolipoprotein N-acyltransferase [Treponema sp.]|jgi:apolipoprotein N-acyltransferase|nr:apolipoprotein N-acyltransferase [Treponema sp.]
MTIPPQKTNNEKESGWVKIFTHLGLIVLAAILFAASFPNLLFKNGVPLLAWFAYIPVLLVIRKNGVLACAGWGAVYGCAAYSIFNYWLGAFHPLAGTIVYSIYLVFLSAVFALLKLAEIFYPKRAYLVQWTIWLAYEYLRTKGFLGYSYGITGYSQWRVIPLIQIASVTGVWGVSALAAFPSFWLAAALRDLRLSGTFRQKAAETGRAVFLFFQKEKISAVAWAAALAAALVFGAVSNRDFSSFPTAQIALIQHNTDPWEASKAPTTRQINEAYRNDLAILKRLSDEALASAPKPQLVVLPETAFVPRIYWHTNYRDDQNSWLLVKELLEYLSAKDVPFLIGNDDARMEPAKNPDPQKKYRVDYNAALLFEKGQITETYRKLHLVPFTEHFPYKRQFPFIYNALEKADTHFWEKGEEATVFSGPGFSFSAPICFEDTFGYLSRNFVCRGADVLVNLSNDAWSNSLPAQNQHLSMAVFRAVENRRPMVRSTASGQTCAIDPRGRVIAMSPPFSQAWLNVEIPIVSGNTLYTQYGDYFAVFFTFIAVILLLSGAVSCTIRKTRKG